MTNFSESFLSTHTLSLWNSDLWAIFAIFSESDRPMDTPYYLDTSKKKTSINFLVISTYFFEFRWEKNRRRFDVLSSM